MRFQEYITEGKNENILETASCCGIFLSEEQKKILFEYEDSQEALDVLNNVIKSNSDRDWSLKSLKEANDRIISQALGMYFFIQSADFPLDKNNLDFIHKSINDYYKLEKKFFNLPKGKQNTADVVLVEGNRKNVLKVLKDGKDINVNEENGLIDIDGVKFIQVSLKAGKETKLGNVKTFLKQRGIDPRLEKGDLLDESIIKTIKDKISRLLSSFKKKIFKVFKKYDNIKVEYTLDEETVHNLFQEVNSYLKNIERKSYEEFPVIVKEQVRNEPSTFQEKFHMLCNRLVLRDIANEIIERSRENGNLLKDMIIDGYFGSTELPLWIVFGYPKQPDYLGTKEELGKKLVVENAEIGAFVCKKHKKHNYYVTDFYVLDGMDEEGNKKYLNLGVIPKPSVKSMAIEFRSTVKKVKADKSIKDIL